MSINSEPLAATAPASTALKTIKRAPALATAAVLVIAVIWCFWTTLLAMADRWARDPQYSHGFIVPVFALLVLWFRRERLRNARWEPSLLGLPILLGGVVLRLLAVRQDTQPLDAFALVPTLFGLVLFVGGKSVLRWSWPALAFLTFMVPLPFVIDVALAYPLRRLATNMSTYLLQTFGYPAISEGNIILIDQVKLGVVDACSGLGMLMTFFALATALALVSKAPLSDRLVLVLTRRADRADRQRRPHHGDGHGLSHVRQRLSPGGFARSFRLADDAVRARFAGIGTEIPAPPYSCPAHPLRHRRPWQCLD